MNIREAILKAADHIERNPTEFNYWSTVSPNHPGCGSPGCAIGWIGTFAGVGNRSVIDIARDVLGCVSAGWDHAGVFYERLKLLPESAGWRTDPLICARTLHLYADKYHPAESVACPDWMAIARGDVKCVEGV